MKTSYTIEEWTNLGLLEDVPAHRTEQVVHALNYYLAWIDRTALIFGDFTIIPLIIMTIATVIDLDDDELEKILDQAKNEYDDFIITSTYYGLYEEAEFKQQICEKIIKQHINKLQLN
jgi:predicted class III extradiol MEMO1 family dioxygenase